MINWRAPTFTGSESLTLVSHSHSPKPTRLEHLSGINFKLLKPNGQSQGSAYLLDLNY